VRKCLLSSKMSMATTTGPSGQPAMEPEWAAESNLTRILAVSTIVHIVTFVLVCLRLYARGFVLRKPATDDILIVGAYVNILKDHGFLPLSSADADSLVGWQS
jgi:hypothetical protein